MSPAADGGVAGGATPFAERFEPLRGHTPPPALRPDPSRTTGRQDEHCATRSELLAQRKQSYIDANEDRKRAHEEANPTWAATLSAAPGERKPSYNRTRTQIQAERRQDRVATSVLASGDGVLEREKAIMLSRDPTALVTTISRPHAYGPELPLTYVEQPALPTRSALMHARRQDLLGANAQTMKRIGQHGYRSFYQRVGDRLDSSLKHYYDSQEAGGQKLTRGMLMEARKADFLAENEAFLARHRAHEVREPRYADQAEPFWTLGREVPQPAISSREGLLESQQWYRKREVYGPFHAPREPDPLKVGDAARLADKLSSGPKRAQRGYPAEKAIVADKITAMDGPDPSALHFQRRALHKETVKYLHLKTLSEQPSGGFSAGLAMEQPLYSSFSRDRIFREPPRLPPPHALPARRRSPEARDAGMTRTFTDKSAHQASSPMLMSTRGPAKLGTTGTVRSGGFQVIDTLMATR